MPILRRLFKLVQGKQDIKNSNTANINEVSCREGKKEIIHSNQNPHKKSTKRERISLECNDLNKNLAALIRRHHLRAWFPNSLYTYPICIKKNDIVGCYRNSSSNGQSSTSTTTTAHNVRIEVLPISDSSTRRCEKKRGDGDQNKPKSMSSKMKELVRWHAGSKSHKQTGIKVSYFGKGGSVNELVSESPKISITLIQESCNTIGSNPIHDKGNWITTDDEFVVLEL